MADEVRAIADPAETLRRDARDNRGRILAAAREAFQARGFDVAMRDVALAAGVGVGTLYRRFPSRESLIRAVVLDDMQLAVERMQRARDSCATAWQALADMIREATELQLAIDASLPGEGARAEFRTPEMLAGRGQILRLFEEAVADAQAEGSLRDDVAVGDVAAAVAVLAVAQERSPGLPEGAQQRLLGLLLAGLSGDGRSVLLPGRPLTRADYEGPRG